MLDDVDLIHGAVLRQIVVGAGTAIQLAPIGKAGRINAFAVNGEIGVHVKHSTKRMSPWLFTFHVDYLEELGESQKCYSNNFVVFVCGTDGLVTLDVPTLQSLLDFRASEQAWVRVTRQRRSMYGVSGNSSDLPHKMAHGVYPVLSALKA